MFEQFARLETDHLIFLGIMAALGLTALTILGSTLLVQIRRFRQRQLELGFHEEMLRRGHTVQEISQLLNSRRPTVSQSVAAQAERVTGSLAAASRRFANWVPNAFERCRRRVGPLWHRSAAFCRQGYRHAKCFTRQASQQVRPLMHQAQTAISRCAGLLSNALDSLARRLAPHRP